MTGRLQGKVAIVTGGGQGIGAAISSRFADEGARVVIAQRTQRIADAHVERIRSTGGEAVSVPTDVTDREQILAMVARTTEVFGPPSILVNNAGIAVFKDPLEVTPEDWQRCFGVDLEAAWWVSQAVLPAMLDAGSGSIINIASVHSFHIIPGCFPYPVAKHGLIGLTRALSAEYAARGIRINAVCPGYIETQNVRDHFASFPDPEAERARAGGLHPVGRIGQADEVAGPVLFLASDDASFIHGESLMVDGGMSTILNGHGVPFVPGSGPSGVSSGLDTSAQGRG